jgi:hypothetical protein
LQQQQPVKPQENENGGNPTHMKLRLQDELTGKDGKKKWKLPDDDTGSTDQSGWR